MLQPEVLVGRAHERFDAEGNLTDEKVRSYLKIFLEHFEEWITSHFLLNKIYGMPAKAPTFQEVEFGSKPQTGEKR